MWLSCGLKLASPGLNNAIEVFIFNFEILIRKNLIDSYYLGRIPLYFPPLLASNIE